MIVLPTIRGMLPTVRAKVTAATPAVLGQGSLVLAAPRPGHTDQFNLVCGPGFRFQKPLNHLAAGSRGQLSFFGPLQSSQLRRKGMERDDGSRWCFHNFYTLVRVP